MPKVIPLLKTVFIIFVFLILNKTSAQAVAFLADTFSGGYNRELWINRSGYLDPVTSAFGIGDNIAGNWYILDSSIDAVPANSRVKFDMKINSIVSEVIFSCKTYNPPFIDNDLRVYLRTNGTATFDSYINGGGIGSSIFHWDNSPGIHTFELTCVNGIMSLKEDEVFLSSWNSNRDFTSQAYVYFGYRNGNSEFANYQLCDDIDCFEAPTPTLSPTSTPTPTPTPTPTATPTPTPYPTIGPFELPVNYTDRGNNTPTQFKNAFWNRLTAAFDHVFSPGTFRPFTGDSYKPNICPVGAFGISCYDSHNGTDFSQIGGQDVYSVSTGTVSFTSDHDSSTCTPNKGGFGCVVIINYSNGTYGLFAHLDKIFVQTNDTVYPTSIIGEMGKTGCPKCGEHLHFGVLQSLGSPFLIKTMSRANWQELLYQIKPLTAPVYKPYCSYTAPNGAMFSFQDPNGWVGIDADPWSLSKTLGGCGVSSPYLWKYAIGTTP